MTKKRRYLISAGVLAACACITLCVFALLPLRLAVTKANFDRIKDVMTKIEVERQLGPPSDVSPGGRNCGDYHTGMLTIGHERVVWGGDDGVAVITFDRESRIFQKSWIDDQQSFLDKFRRWLHLPK